MQRRQRIRTVLADGAYNWLYDDAGRVTREQPLGFRVEYTYDDADRVTKKFSYDRTSLVTVTRFDYKYDNVGNRRVPPRVAAIDRRSPPKEPISRDQTTVTARLVCCRELSKSLNLLPSSGERVRILPWFGKPSTA